MRRGVRRGAMTLGMAAIVVALLPSYLRAYTIAGDSDAPAYVTGDRVFVNLAAYDLRIPYSNRVLGSFGDPKPGDMILFHGQDGRPAVKRVVAGPGARVEMRNNHLIVDDRPLEYQPVSDQEKHRNRRGSMGTALELEQGNGPQVYISYTPGSAAGSFEPVQIPKKTYFLLGSNRDVSVDSRSYGPIHRSQILGRVVGRRLTPE